MTVSNIKFKSNPEFYSKEEYGLKPNTIRKPNEPNDIRFNLLEEFRNGERNLLTLDIVNTVTGQSFHRWVNDVSFYDGYYIISWNHSQSKTKEKDVSKK